MMTVHDEIDTNNIDISFSYAWKSKRKYIVYIYIYIRQYDDVLNKSIHHLPLKKIDMCVSYRDLESWLLSFNSKLANFPTRGLKVSWTKKTKSLY